MNNLVYVFNRVMFHYSNHTKLHVQHQLLLLGCVVRNKDSHRFFPHLPINILHSILNKTIFKEIIQKDQVLNNYPVLFTCYFSEISSLIKSSYDSLFTIKRSSPFSTKTTAGLGIRL